MWNPIDGSVRTLANFTENGVYTEGSISLDAEGSVFVVFKENRENMVFVKPESTNTSSPNISFFLSKTSKLKLKSSKMVVFQPI
ncbi:MAG: hypothetical protein HC817_01620 [Saprospiraceae bacterium]|nr:hypothetical protein [Saprospiraceae bacterium]